LVELVELNGAAWPALNKGIAPVESVSLAVVLLEGIVFGGSIE
jgi:hypothetical protein